MKALYPVHCALLEGFKKCVEFSKTDIAKCFLDAERDLLNYVKYAARLPMAVEKVRHTNFSLGLNNNFVQAKELATRSDTCQLIQDCQERTHQRFPLSDLLSVPIQRFLKYPLLTKVHSKMTIGLVCMVFLSPKELLKCAKKAAVPNQADIKSLETANALVEVGLVPRTIDSRQ